MLEVGRLRNFSEDRTHFAAWAVMSSPLILSFDLRVDRVMDTVWPIISNRDVLHVNQAWAGSPGDQLYVRGRPTGNDGDSGQVWAKPVGQASWAVLFISTGPLNASLSQYWAGSYRSSWTLDTSSGALEGSIKCLIHYFEDGNVQLDDGASFKASVDVSGDVGAALAKAVKAHEAPFMEKLEDIYLNLSKDLLGALRRRLPVTKQKFDWERAGTGGVAKLGKNLQEMAAKG